VFEAPPDLRTAEVPQVCLDSSHLPGLRASGLRTNNLLIRSARFTGSLQLAYTEIAGVCDLSETSLRTGDRQALSAPSLRVGKDLSLAGLLAESSTAAPAVDLTSSAISGNVTMVRTAAVNRHGAAISLRRATVGDCVTLIDACARGAIDLDGIVVGKNITFRGSTLLGVLWLEDARVGLNVLIYGAHLRNVGKLALKADRADVGGSFHIRSGTEIIGAVSIRSTSIGSQLSVVDSTIVRTGPADSICLARTKLGRSLEMPLSVLLSSKDFTAHLDGLSYPDPPLGEGDWLELLTRYSTTYQPQAYQQLATVHRAAGHEQYARKVLIAQQKDLGRRGDPGNRLWHRFLGVTLAYGYKPSRAVSGLLATFVLALSLVWTADAHNGLTPAKDRPADSCSPVNRISLAADLAIPLVKLGGTPRCELANGPAGQWATGAGWVVQILGWSFATLSVAGFTGLVRKS